MIRITKYSSVDLEGITLKLLKLSISEWNQDVCAAEIDIFYGKAVNGSKVKVMINYPRKQIIASVYDDSFKKVYASFEDLPGLTTCYPH